MSEERSIAELDDWLTLIEEALTRNPHFETLLYEHAITLHALGRNGEAERAYHRVLARNPRQSYAYLGLANLALSENRLDIAVGHWQRLLTACPDLPEAYLPLAEYALFTHDDTAARDLYTRVLTIAPNHSAAHRGLAVALDRLGDRVTAGSHARRSIEAPGWNRLPCRDPHRSRRVAILVSQDEQRQSLNLGRLIDGTIFERHLVTVEEIDLTGEMPDVHLVVVGIGDAERAENGLHLTERLLDGVTVPVINRPEHLLRTSRIETAQRLATIPQVRIPHIAMLSRTSLSTQQRKQTLERSGFVVPFLIRVPGHFAGRQFWRIDDAAELDRILERTTCTDFLAIEYIDTRDEGGIFCKYRSMWVDGHLYPLHLARSPSWKMHYFNADMSHNRTYREQEQRFLDDHEAILGTHHLATLTSIFRILDLDYAGIDYAFDQENRLVLFEANAGMWVAPPGPEAIWDYRRKSTNAILQAVTTMLRSRASTIAKRPFTV